MLYFGARDNKLRVVALDRDKPTELWSLDAYSDRVVWNDDWDSNPAVVDDMLYEGGENGWFYAVELNRGFDDDGKVVVDPEVVVRFPAFTDELLETVGRELSIENSVVVLEDRVYFANSGGRLVGLDVSDVRSGDTPVVFDYWLGDDVDATITVDPEGMLYVAIELQRFNKRGEEIGQLVKINPAEPDDPVVWSVAVPPRGGGEGGLWATPAIGDGVLYAATHPGELLAVSMETGEVLWRDEIGPHAWSSPIVVDDLLVVAVDCNSGGGLRGYDVSDPALPVERWTITVNSGCIESTPILWEGLIYVGSRDGYFYAFGDPVASEAP